MGVPTVLRPETNYLLDTVRSLVDNMSAEEAADTLIVVFVAETSRRNVDAVVGPFEAEFSSQIHSGLIELIGPPTEGLYPDFDKVEATLGDSDVSELNCWHAFRSPYRSELL